jgi:hypothetical protein
MTLVQLLKAIQNHLTTDPELSFVETAVIRKYKAKSLPSFQNYAIIISPNSRSKESLANRVKQTTYRLNIVCVVRNFDPELSLIGEPPEAAGIIHMVDVVEISLGAFENPGIEKFNNEINQEINYEEHAFPDREGAFHETVLTYTVKMKPEVT